MDNGRLLEQQIAGVEQNCRKAAFIGNADLIRFFGQTAQLIAVSATGLEFGLDITGKKYADFVERWKVIRGHCRSTGQDKKQ